MFFKKVDIVYLWVDGTDKWWQKRKEDFYNQHKDIFNSNGYEVSTINEDKRYIENNELKFSLRSLNKYANWINNIYIVTDKQIPIWLDVNNDRVHVIDHKQIMSKDSLPCFNSIAIEHAVDKILGLNEHFILSCDDYFFYKKTNKRFFFTILGKPKYRTFYWYFSEENIIKKAYCKNVDNAIKAVRDKFNKNYSYVTSHCMSSLTKNIYKKCYIQFPSEIETTLHHPFRNFNDVHFTLYQIFACATNTAKLILEAENSKEHLYYNYNYVKSVVDFKDRIFNFLKLGNNTDTQPRKKESNIENIIKAESNNACQIEDKKKNQHKGENTNCLKSWKKVNKSLKIILSNFFVHIVVHQRPSTISDLHTKRPNLFCINEFKPEFRTKLLEELESMYPEKSEFEL